MSTDTPPAVPQKVINGCGCGLGLLVVLFAAVWGYDGVFDAYRGRARPARRAPKPPPTLAADAAEIAAAIHIVKGKAVWDQLWSPQRAEFEEVPLHTVRCNPPRYTVTGYVRAVHPDGQRRRQRYVATVEHVRADLWQVISCTLDPPQQ